MNKSLGDRCFQILRKVLQAHAILPESFRLTNVTPGDAIRCTSGEFADTWQAQMGGRQVFVKAFRAPEATNLDRVKRVCQYFHWTVTAT